TDSLPLAYRTVDIGNLMSKDDLNKIIAKLGLVRGELREQFNLGLGLIFIDTVSTSFIMEDEGNGEAAKVCAHLKKIADATDAFTIGVHHFGKDIDKGLRGGSAFRANVDQVLVVLAARTQDGQVTNRRFSIEKNRDGVEGPVCGIEFDEVTVGTDGD